MSNYIGDFTEDFATLNVKFLTVDLGSNSTRVPTTLAGTPVISVYKDNSLTQITAGITLTVDFDGITGMHNVLIDLSADAAYTPGADYQIVITTGTVDAISAVGRVVGTFSIENRSLERVVNITSNLPTGAAASSVAPESAVVTTGSEVNTYVAAQSLDGGYHEVSDVGGVIDFYYQFDVGNSQIGTSIAMNGRLEGKDDVIAVQAYDWVSTSWKGIGSMIGATAGSPDGVAVFTVTSAMTSTTHKVRIRGLASGLTGATFFIDRAVMRYTSQIVQSVGYANGRVWVDTVHGVAGTEIHVNGVADNSVDTLADAITIADELNLHDFHMTSDSVFAPSSDFQNSNVYGIGYTVTLGNHDYAGTHIFHASPLTGKATTTGGSDHFDVVDSGVGDVEVDEAHFVNCAFSGTITLDQLTSGDISLVNSRSNIAGAATPILDCGIAAVTHAIAISDWQNGLEIRNLNNGGTNLFSISGTGKLIVASTCSGTMNVRGAFEIIDNSGGNVTFVYDDIHEHVTDILVDTGTTLPATLATIAGYIDTEIATIIANLGTVDTVVDGIQTDLSNATDGLGALKALIDTLDTVADAVKVKTDQLTFTKALELDTNTQSINGATVVGDGNATPWDGA